MSEIVQRPRVVATVECRVSSSRLPGKVMFESCGKPLLAHMVERLKRVSRVDAIVLATTVNSLDDCIETLAADLGVGCLRGSEEDVLRRVLQAAESVDADVIVETTGDCPLIDPDIVAQTLELYLLNDADYVANDLPPMFPMGMDVEVFSTELLRRADRQSHTREDREHVSYFFVRQLERFRHLILPAPPPLYWPELRLTLDEQADYELIDAVYSEFLPHHPEFTCGDVIDFCRAHPELPALNGGVVQKGWEAA